MTKTMRKFIVSVCIASSAMALLLFALRIPARGEDSPKKAGLPPLTQQAVTPTILLVHPAQAPNHLDTNILISGTDFQAELKGTLVLTGPSVHLDGLRLPTVGWVSSTTLTATVPWGLAPGVYTLTVVNPDGGIGTLTNAFTVEQAIGVWTTGGPYGGQIHAVAVSPVTSRTAYAIAFGAGLFRTTDGGDWWETVIADQGAKGVTYGPPPTHTLYYWGAGLHRSDDGGETWQALHDAPHEAFAYAPQDARQLWIGGGAGIFHSENGGVTWAQLDTGLPEGSWPTLFAIHPTNPDVVYAGLNNGQVYKTASRGQQWRPAKTGLPDTSTDHPVQALAIHPFDPDVVLVSRMHEYDVSHYRSIDGGATWAPLQAAPELGGGFISDIAFSHQVSGTVYATMMGHPLIHSSNGGISWTAVCTDVADGIYSLGLDPVTEIPRYLGGWASGTYRSHDGGRTFERATEGIAALWVVDMATSAGHPQTVYTAVDSDAFKSNDGGHSWQRLPLEQAFSVAVDPQNHRRAYVGWAGIERTADGGKTWMSSPVPTDGLGILEITVNPFSPTLVFAGGQSSGENNEWMDQRRGIILRSDDYGATWSQLDVGQPISMVNAIVVDPTDGQTIYLTSNGGGRGGEWTFESGLGIFRSRDGGDTWEPLSPLSPEMENLPVSALTIHPENPQIMYVGAALDTNGLGRVFKTTNGGDSWTMTNLMLTWGWVNDLALDPLMPNTIYAATDEGLFISRDGGDTWERATGTLGEVEIWGLMATFQDERTIFYLSTLGGFPSAMTSAEPSISAATQNDFVQAGVYQKILMHHWIYLPNCQSSSR